MKFIVEFKVPQNKQELFKYLHTAWESLQPTYFYKWVETMLKICPAVKGLVSLFNGILTFVGYLMPKPFSKNSSGTI